MHSLLLYNHVFSTYFKEEEMQKKSAILQQIHRVVKIHTNKHFVYSGGQHGDQYTNYRPLGSIENLPILRQASLYLFRLLLRYARIDSQRPVALLGPETIGDAMVTQIWYASSSEFPQNFPRTNLTRISCRRNRTENRFELELPFKGALTEETQVLWFDDVLNAASTFLQVRPLIEVYGASFAGMGVIGDSSGFSAKKVGVPYIAALERQTAQRFDPKVEPCLLCERHVPIVRRPGHGHTYEKSHPDYQGGYEDVPA